MSLLLKVRLHKTKAVIQSERPWWVGLEWIDAEAKRQLEIKDKPKEKKS